MSNAQIIDMSKLPAPTVVVVPSFEDILAQLKTELVQAMPTDQQESTRATLELESEPLTKWLERLAYQLVIERSDRNDSAHAVMLAYASGSDLDNLGAFFGVERLTITPADPSAVPPTEAVKEDDSAFRARIQLAPRGYSVAGPVAAYIYHAQSASGQVLDASATSPSPGQVLVSVLSTEGDGTPSAELLAAVEQAVNADDVRPLTDHVQVQPASIVRYGIEATLYTLPGPDSSTVLATAQQRAQAYALSQRAIGVSPTLSGIYAALHVDGVQRVALTSPSADLAIGATQAAYCERINITFGGTLD